MDYIQPITHQSKQPNRKGKTMKYWIESSYDFEDEKKQYPEHWVIAIDRDAEGTETIATFTMWDKRLKTELDDLIESINNEIT